MYVINLDEKKLYEFAGEKGAEEIMNDMFEEYFQRTYQESTVKSLVEDMWKHIEIKIPKKVEVFLLKDEMLYYIEAENADEDENKHEDEDCEYEDEFVRFEVAPRSFFKIKKDVHKVLKKCFDECNEKFTKIMQNITSETGWKSISFIMVNVRCTKYPVRMQCRCENLEEILKGKQQNFEKLVGKYLKEEKLCKEVALKMLKRYREILLENNPIMFITNSETEEIYAIDNKLVAKRVSFSSIEEYLEKIVGEILPSDYEFLVNRIYNYIVFHKEEIPAQIRIKKVTKNGRLIGFIYGIKEKFPIVKSEDGEYFTIITIKPNEKMERVKERFGSSVSIETNELIVTDNISIIGEIDENIFPEYGYIEVVGNCYNICDDIDHPFSCHKRESNFNHILLFENNECKEVFDCPGMNVSETEANKIKEFHRQEKNRIHYAFFQTHF